MFIELKMVWALGQAAYYSWVRPEHCREACIEWRVVVKRMTNIQKAPVTQLSLLHAKTCTTGSLSESRDTDRSLLCHSKECGRLQIRCNLHFTLQLDYCLSISMKKDAWNRRKTRVGRDILSSKKDCLMW